MSNSRLLYLPASTLLLVISLFALKAISTPSLHPPMKHLKAENAKDTLPVLGTVKDFEFTERHETQVSANDLRGKIWVADFIFTSCQKECPLMSAEMQKIQAVYPETDRFKLVSFSVDPAVDTPKRLREYAQHFKANQNWLFLTGKRQTLHQLAKDSFMLPVVDLNAKIDHDHGSESDATHHKGTQDHKHGAHQTGHNTHSSSQHDAHHKADSTAESSAGPASSPFLHSQKFVLVDSQLQIRGYYDSTSPEELAQLIQTDIPALLKG